MLRGLLVGINTYKWSDKTAVPDLQGCINDVVGVLAFLKRLPDFHEENFQLLKDADATAEAIKKHIRTLIADVRAGDKIIFHYSGHGTQVPDRNPKCGGVEDAICPYDFSVKPPYDAITAHDFELLFGRAAQNSAEILFVSDSCHSGELVDADPGQDAFRKSQLAVQKFIKPPNDQGPRQPARTAANQHDLRHCGGPHVTLLAACTSGQVTHDAKIGHDYHGVFTFYLLDILRTDGPSKSLHELRNHLSKKIREKGYAQQTPYLEPLSSKQTFVD